VASIVDKMCENRLRWLGHVLRREKTEAVSVTKNMSVDGKIDGLKLYENDRRL